MNPAVGLPARLGIVTGIAAEAKIARVLSPDVTCSGGRPEIAARQAEQLIAEGAQALMSFGIAGGLMPGLRPGTLIVANEILTVGTRYPALTNWAGTLDARLGVIFGDIKIASEVSEKSTIFENTGALAVDLESGPVARVAARAGIPFVALRAIADPAGRALPAAALLPLDPEGRPRIAAVLASIAKRPGQIPGLVSTALDTRAALRALLRACRILV